MICEFCEEKISNEVTVMQIGFDKTFFCNTDCQSAFIENCTTNEIIEDDLLELEDLYRETK